MFRTLRNLVPLDKDLPARTHKVDVLQRVLEGTIYDVLAYEFHEERNGAGEYIPIARRAPSVRSGLCRVVVDDSVALLFGEGRFPGLITEDEPTKAMLASIVKDVQMPAAMLAAAIQGSVGSVVVQFRVLKGRIFLAPMSTLYLTPEWDAEAPDTLVRVTEMRKVQGEDLAAQGYAIPDDAMQTAHWFKRVWDTTDETWYLPRPVSEVKDGKPLLVDQARSVQHNLGFCPMVWIRNLPGGDETDGACTFAPAISTVMEIDYQMSQAGRGLRYSSDPTLLIKEPAVREGQQVQGGGNAIIVDADGDAKMLEINGTAAAAVIDYVKALRESALEATHGNRSNADKLSAAQSGRALELLHQPLIWLADRLRHSYGENGLLDLVRMIVAAANKMPLVLRDGTKVGKLATTAVTLKWPPWFDPTETDKQAQAGSLSTLRTAGLMSRETSVTSLAPIYDIEDVQAELAKIEADEAAADEREAAQVAAQTKITESAPG